MRTHILRGITPGMVATMQFVALRVEPFLGYALEMALRARVRGMTLFRAGLWRTIFLCIHTCTCAY
jgi:hypothetical protein